MDCYIIDAKRSPRALGKSRGKLYPITPVDLLSQILNTLPVSYADDMLTGCVMPINEQGSNIARAAILKSKLSNDTPGMQINRFCTSSLDAMNLLNGQIASGHIDMGIASGVECMSRIPMLSDGGAILADPSIVEPNAIVPQGIIADLIATEQGYSRQDLDQFACLSQTRAKHAINNQYLHSIVPIKDPLGNIVIDEDEYPRPTTLEDLAKLKPSFLNLKQFDSFILSQYPHLESLQHLHHAGNASAIVDGAAAVLLANQSAIEQHNLSPKAKIIATSQVGGKPTSLVEPVQAIKKALAKTNLNITDIDLWEINEAFSSVILYITEKLNLDLDRVNVNGGAIAYGHPLGATGAMLVGTLIDELIRQDKQFGVIALCSVTGMASCSIIERVP